MGGWTGIHQASESRGFAPWALGVASRLYPHRVTLVTVSLAAFLAGALPLVAVVEGRAALTPWRTSAFAMSVPVVLWALGLAIHATFFDPERGIVESLRPERVSAPGWVRAVMRAYAMVTVAGFALAPLIVLGSAAFA